MPKAKLFLIDRILEEAKSEGTSLTEIEIRMLTFSEATSGLKDLEAADIFERDYDDEEYEAKIASLIRRAYEHDKQSGRQEAWDDALVRVAGRDLYLNVMIDRSGIETGSLGIFGDWRFFLYAVSPWVLSVSAAFLVGFSPFAARLIRSDLLRLTLALGIFASPYVLLRRRKPKRHRAAKQSRSVKLDRSS
jgi:hypothetical protein